jgi:hypothetical protein
MNRICYVVCRRCGGRYSNVRGGAGPTISDSWGAIMDAYIFRFDAKKLRAIPRRYLGFLVASGHCCNELSVLLPYIIFDHDLTDANEFEAALY